MTPNQLKTRIAAAAGEPKVMLSHAEAEGLLAALTPAVATSPGSPPSVEGLDLEGFDQTLIDAAAIVQAEDNYIASELVRLAEAFPWLLDRAREAETAKARADEAFRLGVEWQQAARDAEARLSALTAQQTATAVSREEIAQTLRDLLALPVGVGSLKLLDRGIGTSTPEAAWLRAREVLSLLSGGKA